MNRKALSEQCARSRLLDVALSIPRARFNVDASSVAPRRRRRCRRFVTTLVAREETTARNGKAVDVIALCEHIKPDLTDCLESEPQRQSQGSSNLIPLEPELGRLGRQKKKGKALETEMAGNDDNLQLRDAPHDHQIYHNEQVLPAVGGQHGNDRPNIQQPAAAARQPDDLVEKGQVKEALNKDNHTMHKKSDAKAKKKLKGKRIKGDPHLMLIPHSCSNGIIDYEVKCKGTSKPFLKVRAVLTPEMKEKGMETVKGFVSKSTHVPISKDDLVEKGQVKEALNKDNHTMHKKSDAKAKKKLKGKRIKGDPHLMLIPHSCSNGIIDYEVKCKGTSKPFLKVRAVLTPEMKEKGMETVKGFVSKVLKLKVFDGTTIFFRTNRLTNALVTILLATHCRFYNMKTPKWIDLPVPPMLVWLSEGSRADFT
ncbi:hypothetical protein F2Q69_00022878 [Brassica cretica]|uniref:Uncharacterized protein n=1 Tax=Brassica cretica TaxID=69181 RepID=A0A8S9QMN9_BRACR|nr:hypothetical protein F2Q69_00022878 [Brassica cretica]